MPTTTNNTAEPRASRGSAVGPRTSHSHTREVAHTNRRKKALLRRQRRAVVELAPVASKRTAVAPPPTANTAPKSAATTQPSVPAVIEQQLMEEQWRLLLVKLANLRVSTHLYVEENIRGHDCGATKGSAGPALPTSAAADKAAALLTDAEKSITAAVAVLREEALARYPRLDVPAIARLEVCV